MSPMHTKEDQRLLDSMSQQEKDARTTIRAMKDRGIVLYETTSRAICKSEMPYVWSEDHFVCRYKKHDSKDPSDMAWVEFGNIMKDFPWYGFKRWKKTERSCSRYHIHIYN